MTAQAFVDSNILLYAISEDPSEARKTEIATELLRRGDIGLSTQVLQEFHVNATRKAKGRLPIEKAIAYLDLWSEFMILPVTAEIVREALHISHRHQLSYWDAAIIAAAQSLKATTLFTEDLQHGQRFGGVRVVNPFK